MIKHPSHPSHGARLQNLFAQTRELPATERDAFLARACGDNAELHLEVQRLLVDAERAASFFGDTEGATLGAEEFKETKSIRNHEKTKVREIKELESRAIHLLGVAVIHLNPPTFPVFSRVFWFLFGIQDQKLKSPVPSSGKFRPIARR